MALFDTHIIAKFTTFGKRLMACDVFGCKKIEAPHRGEHGASTFDTGLYGLDPRDGDVDVGPDDLFRVSEGQNRQGEFVHSLLEGDQLGGVSSCLGVQSDVDHSVDDGAVNDIKPLRKRAERARPRNCCFG